MTYLSNGWSLSGTEPDGTPVVLGATTAEVARRQADGTWRYVIDNAWATRRSPASHRWATGRSTEGPDGSRAGHSARAPDVDAYCGGASRFTLR